MKLNDSIIVYVKLSMRTTIHVTMGTFFIHLFSRIRFISSYKKHFKSDDLIYFFTSPQSEIEMATSGR